MIETLGAVLGWAIVAALVGWFVVRPVIAIAIDMYSSGPGMSRTHWTKPWGSPGWIRFTSNTNPDYSVITGLRMSLLS